jgi:hypothetical protein
MLRGNEEKAHEEKAHEEKAPEERQGVANLVLAQVHEWCAHRCQVVHPQALLCGHSPRDPQVLDGRRAVSNVFIHD